MIRQLWKILLVINLILLVLAGIWGWRLYQSHRDDEARQERLADLAIREQELTANKGAVQQQIGVIDHTFVSVAYPLDTQSSSVEVIKERIDAFLEERYGNSREVLTITDAIYIDTTVTETNFEGVKHYQIDARTYKDSQKSFDLVTSEVIQTYDLKVDGQPLALTELIEDPERFKIILSSQIEENLLNQEAYPEDADAKLIALGQVDINTLSYTYTDGQFTVTLPEAIGELSQVSLPLSSLFAVINAAYLKGQDLADYQTYLTEQERLNSEKRIALTFDDGPNPATTVQILDILAKYHIKATFYVIGSKVAGNEAILKRMTAEGHEIGNHTWSHPVLTKLSIADIQNEVRSTSQAIQTASGQTPKTIRPPYGATNATVASAVSLPQVLWTVDTRDWENHNPAQILANVKSYARPNGVVLMHDIHQETANAVESVIRYLQQEGYNFETVSELYGY